MDTAALPQKKSMQVSEIVFIGYHRKRNKVTAQLSQLTATVAIKPA